MTAAASGARLIVNADDFGLHGSINAAIVEGHRNGIITSCSIVADDAAESFHEAVRLAHENPALDVGLHFALIGLPGLPTGYAAFLRDYLAGRFPPSRIEQLLRGQLQILISSGIRPSHIDSHQHLHALPGVMRVVCRVAEEEGIRALRLPLERSPIDAPLGRIAASRALGIAAAASRHQINRHGLWHPDWFLGMAVSGHLTENALLRLIDRVPAGGVTEILCHPGMDNQALAERFDWGYNWEGELAAVTSEAARRRIAERGIAPATFANAARGETHPA